MIRYLKKTFSFSKTDLIVGGGLVLILIFYYAVILTGRIATDLQPHARMAYGFAQQGVKLPANFLYFFLVALFSGFSKHYVVYYIPTVFLLCTAITAKYFITKHYLTRLCLFSDKKATRAYLLAAAMLFVFALPGVNYFLSDEFYMGQLVPNVWHNSTVIFLMPFSILLFFKSYDYLFLRIEKSQKEKLEILLLVLANALIKPSFLFALLPSVAVYFLIDNIGTKKSKIPWTNILPFLIGVVVIAVEYYLIYKLYFVGSAGNEKHKSDVIIAPFVIWKIFSPNCMVAFLTSCFFPLLYIIITKGQVLKNKLVQFAAVNYVMGLLIWILLAEDGIRKSDGNFYWQIVAVSYLLFFTLLIEFVNSVRSVTLTKTKQWLIGGAFSLHFIWGVYYWLKIIIFKGYS